MASRPRPWSRAGCSSSPGRTRPCLRRSGWTMPTSWPTPTAACGAPACQYQVRNLKMFYGKIEYSFDKKHICTALCEIPSLHIIMATLRIKPSLTLLNPHVFTTCITIDSIFYSFPSLASYSLNKIKSHLLSELNSHFKWFNRGGSFSKALWILIEK